MKKAFEISGEIFKEDSNDFLKDNKTKTIVVSGNNGSGKTIVSVILSKYIEKQNKKVLLRVDYNVPIFQGFRLLQNRRPQRDYFLL